MPLSPRALLILALILAPIALPAVDAQAAPAVEASWTADGLLVALTRDADFEGRVLVTHDDPLAGTVVDRLVDVSLTGGERLSFTVAGLRPDVAHRVRVLLPGEGPDRMPSVDLYDGASVGRLRPLASADAPAGPSSGVFRVPIWNVTLLGANDGPVDHRLVVTREGVVALAYAHRPTGLLALRLSRDGGHAWTDELRIAGNAPGTEYTWDMEQIVTGEIAVVYRDRGASADAWSHVRVGPLNGTVRTLAPTSTTGAVRQYAAMNPALLSDGSALWSDVPVGDPVARLWRFVPGLAPIALGTVASPATIQALAVAGDGSRAVLAFTALDRLHVARSTDGGATLAPAAEVRSLTRIQANATVWTSDIRIATDGTVHLLAPMSVPNSPSSVNYVDGYVRIDPLGVDTARLTSTHGSGKMALDGSRVAVTGFDGSGYEHVLESRDAGRTFGAPLFIEPFGVGQDWGFTSAIAFLPDGRVVMSGRTVESYPGVRDGVAVALPFDPEPTESPVFSVFAREPPSTQPTPTPTTMPPTVVTTAVVERPPAATPTVPLEAVADVENVVLALSPDVVRLAPGRVATVRALVTNLGSGDRGAELPTIMGLPPGVTARVTFDGELIVADGVPANWTHLPAGETRTFDIVLTAAIDAGNASAVAHVLARHATDRPTLTAALGVEVAPATDAAAEGRASLLQGAPVAALVLGGVGAAAGAIVLAARTDVGKIVAGAATLPLYSRIKKADVLRHEVRAGVYEQIRTSPGSRFEELRQTLALPAGVLTFHLGVLEREGYVRTSRDWTRRRYYVQGALLPVAASSTEQTLEALLTREPGMGAGEVAARLGISRQLARYHLKRLERQGWVRAEGEGTTVGYRLVRR